MQETIVSSKDAIWCDLKGEAVILHVPSGVYFGLEGVALDTWEFIQHPRTIDEIVDHLIAVYEVPVAECTERVTGFLADLAKHKLVVVSNEGAGSEASRG